MARGIPLLSSLCCPTGSTHITSSYLESPRTGTLSLAGFAAPQFPASLRSRYLCWLGAASPFAKRFMTQLGMTTWQRCRRCLKAIPTWSSASTTMAIRLCTGRRLGAPQGRGGIATPARQARVARRSPLLEEFCRDASECQRLQVSHLGASFDLKSKTTRAPSNRFPTYYSS